MTNDNKTKDLHSVNMDRAHYSMAGQPNCVKRYIKKLLDHNSHQPYTKMEEDYSDSTELYIDSDSTELYNDSDCTELYDLDEVIIGTKEYQDLKLNTAKTITTTTHKDSLERKTKQARKKGSKIRL